jgi:Pyruvate/2-oxoacid:ferredoxin oxidoreductase delta subunit
MLALESIAQLPAQRDEVAEAIEEGVAVVDGAMLTAAVDAGGFRLVLKCMKVRFEPGACRGQFTVTPIGGTEFELAADAIVPSIGQDPELSAFATLACDGALLRVGGDVASLARFVTEAIGMGKRAAREIDRALHKVAHAPGNDEESIVDLANINTFYHPKRSRALARTLDVAARLRCDDEVQLGFNDTQALAEAERCFSCGTCIVCDNCVRYCPDLAVERANVSGYLIRTDYCKGCGLCVRECPTGSMKMIEEQR